MINLIRCFFLVVMIFHHFSASAQTDRRGEIIDFVWVADGSEIREIKGIPRISLHNPSLTLKVKFKTNTQESVEKIPLKYIWYEFIAPRPVITDIFRANEGKAQTQFTENQDYTGSTTKDGINSGMWVVRILYRNQPLMYHGKVFQPKVIIK